MENFDFNEPISAEIIFEDSDDDDIKPCIHDLNCKLTASADITSTNQYIAGTIKGHNVQEKELLDLIENSALTANKQKTTNKGALDMPSLDELLNEHLGNTLCNSHKTPPSINENSVPNNEQPQTNNQISNKKIRNEQYSFTKNPNNRYTALCNALSNPKSTYSHNVTNETFSRYTANKLKSVSYKKNDSETSIGQTISSSTGRLIPDHSNMTNVHGAQSRGACKSTEQFECSNMMFGYVENILEAVSENMIRILNEYNNYMNVYKTSANYAYIEIARCKLTRAKQHYFNRSYGSFNNIIIPKEYDATFVKNFLDKTIILARSKSYQYSYAQVEPLYYEMKEWAKKRKHNEDLISKHLPTNGSNHPTLTKNLHIIPRNGNRSPPPYRSPAKVDNSISALHNISQMGPSSHGLQVNMLNTDFLNKNRNNQNIQQPLNNSSVALEGHLLRNSYEHQRNSERSVYPELLNPGLSKQNVVDKSYEASTYRTDYNSPNQYLNKQLGSYSGIQSFPTHHHPTENDRRQEQLQYYQRQENVQQDLLTSDQHRLQKPTTNNNQHSVESHRSSISRDSGFMSPQNFDLMTNMQDEPNQDVTPLITHVTSLSSDALHIIEGPCHVCAKSTRKMCQGCYNMYYCSYDCQYKDWDVHMAICTGRVANL